MKAMYALSGDPPTNGHVWIIDEISKISDEIHVALAVNSEKKFMFSIQERLDMMRHVTSHINNITLHNIEGEFLVKYAKSVGCTHLVRGIRSVKDYEYEKSMAAVNSELEPEITTIFLFPPPTLETVSSSFVKSLIGLKGWEVVAKNYVHPFILTRMAQLWKMKKQETWWGICNGY